MASGDRGAAARRTISVSLNDPVFSAFFDFAQVAFPEQPISYAIREALLQFMTSDPMEATRTAARRAAWLHTRRELHAIIGRLFNSIAAQMNDQGVMDSATLSEMESLGEIQKGA